MSASLTPWAIGKHLYQLLLTPQSISTVGALTNTTPTREFFGHLQEVELDLSYELENISPMDRPVTNMVPIELNSVVRFTELEKYSGTNLAAAAAFGFSYFKYSIIRGAQTFIGFGALQSYKMTGTKNRITAQMELAMIDVNETSGTFYPVYG